MSVTEGPLYHVTTLSNFARAFDKYSRRYCKSHIPESSHPSESYLLSWALYQATGEGVNPDGAYINTPINWNNFDWSQVPGASIATTYQAALQDAMNWALCKEK